MAEILSVALRTISCSLEAAAIASTVGYVTTKYATRKEFYNERMLQRTNAKTNECYNKRMLQPTDCVNKIMMLQATEMLQRTMI